MNKALNHSAAPLAVFCVCFIVLFKNWGKELELNEQRLKCEYSDSGKRLNTKHLCKFMREDICVSMNEWVTHACKTPGCSEVYVTVDGYEYLKRSKCALPMEKLKMRKDLPEVCKCCPNSPLPERKNRKKERIRFSSKQQLACWLSYDLVD